MESAATLKVPQNIEMIRIISPTINVTLRIVKTCQVSARAFVSQIRKEKLT